MRLLLDTHTVLWWLDAPKKLGRLGQSMIADPENEVLISPVVPWELALKINSGKMPPTIWSMIFSTFSARADSHPSK